jgi:hypothetical protein
VDALVGAGSLIDAAKAGGQTPLYAAAEGSSLEPVKRLLYLGPDVNAKVGEVRSTVLHMAARVMEPAVNEALLAGSVDITAAAAEGTAPLHDYSAVGSAAAIQIRGRGCAQSR